MSWLGRWLTALCLLGLAVVWVAVPSSAEVAPGYEPQVKLLNPQEYEDDSGNHSGKSALISGEVSAKQAKSNAFWGWLGDHGMGLVKGIGAGLIGAAIVVAAAAVIIGAGAPLLLMAGAAVIGGAIYGAIVGSARFNWTEAVVGSVIGGVSAGVGSWIAGSASPFIARAGAAAADMIGGGIGGVASYLVNEQNPTLGGAAAAFGIGAGTAGLFMGAGAVVSKGLAWTKGALGFGKGAGRGAPKSAVVEASALEEAPSVLPKATTESPDTTASPSRTNTPLKRHLTDIESQAPESEVPIRPEPDLLGPTAEYDVVPYRPTNPGLENHHGVLDAWASQNIPGYISRAADSPTIALSSECHEATKAVFRQWLKAKTGRPVGVKVDWTSVSPQEAYELSEQMFDEAKVPQSVRDDYYRAVHRYIYRQVE